MIQSDTKAETAKIIRCLACLLPFGNGHVCKHCGTSPGNVPWEYPQLQPGSKLHERYLIGKALGRGGFAITYLALQEGLNRRVAIKEYFPSGVADRGSGSMAVCLCKNVSEDAETTECYRRGVERFLEEGQKIVECHQPNPHPNLVRVTDYFEENGTAYLVMDYVEGVSLDILLKMQPRNRLEERQARQLIMPLLSGLTAVHKHGFLHRDVKPSNIYISKEGTVTLIDFGSARQALSNERHTLTVTLTQGYAPPEQYSGNGDQGPWTDVYGAAATLYRCVTGETPPSALSRIASPGIVAPSGFPEVRVSGRVEKAIMAGLQMDYAVRIQSAEEFQQRLGGLRSEVLYETVSVSGLLRNPRQLLRMAFALVMVFMAVGLMTTGTRLIWNRLGNNEAPQLETTEDQEVSKQAGDLYRAGTLLLDTVMFKVSGNEIKRAAVGAGRRAMAARSALDISWVARQSSDAYKVASLLYADGERALGEGKYSDAHAAYDSAADSFAGIILTDKTASSRPRAALDAIREKVGRQRANVESAKALRSAPKQTTLGEQLFNQAIVEYDPSKAVDLYRKSSVIYDKLLPPDSDGILTPAGKVEQRKQTEEANKANKPFAVDPSIPVQEVDLGEGVVFQMVQIPAGEFVMGSPAGEPMRQGDEGPQHRVRITKNYWMGRFEVTVAQFARFVRQTGYRTTAEYAGGAWNMTEGLKQEWVKDSSWKRTDHNPSPDLPVVLVSWDDAQAYCHWLSEATGRVFRLPTEAEWEYACRAGSTTAFQWGNEVEGGEGWLNGADAKLRSKHPEWLTFPFSDGSLYAAKVGSYRGNVWGLHDMHGNVWEWCQDWYAPQYYSGSPETDPFDGQTDRFHVVRGGSWLCYPGLCRSSVRRKYPPEYTTCDLGFRVVMPE
jgi:formylglycine-generating enzyme required for sulfatase activity/serine/threonine protein kinase